MSKPRRVMGLKSASLQSEGPFKNPPPLKGRAAEGIRYQRKVHDKLRVELADQGDILQEQWIRFTDAYGVHWCQLDSAFVGRDRVVVVEAKLSLRQHATGVAQLSRLYRPCLELIYDKPVAMLLAFKYWVPGAEVHTIDSPQDLLYKQFADLKRPWGWHLLI